MSEQPSNNLTHECPRLVSQEIVRTSEKSESFYKQLGAKMKTCSKCRIEKPLSDFNKASKHLDGLRCECRQCQSVYRRINFEKNREKQLKQGQNWKDANRERVRKYSSDWKINNRARATANQMRRHVKKVSSEIMKGDEWNDFYIDEIYELARVRTLETKTAWEVDHILPLQGKLISGLHVWYNLQLLTASKNRSKRNHFSID